MLETRPTNLWKNEGLKLDLISHNNWFWVETYYDEKEQYTGLHIAKVGKQLTDSGGVQSNCRQILYDGEQPLMLPLSKA